MVCFVPKYRRLEVKTAMAARWARLQPKLQALLACSRRRVHTNAVQSVEQLRQRYADVKRATNESLKGAVVDEQGIFPNNELSLRYIDVFGFDYDYTLASYNDALHDLIYDLAIDVLVNSYGYPKGVRSMKYNPDFAVRGLHYDTSNGFLLKVDAFHNVMLGSVYRGLQPVPNEEVFRIYEGTHLAITKLNPSNFITGPRRTMHHMIDLFSYPEMCLLSNVSEYFMQKEIPYDPEYLFRDCGQAVQNVHKTGRMHQEVLNNLGKYLDKSPDLGGLLNRLVSSGKKLFLITNSNFNFVNKGMIHIIGKDWRDLFEVVVTQARKPEFYRQPASRPFRLVDTDMCSPMWKKVSDLKKGEVYMEGNIEQFTHFTNFSGPSVLYFGDHVYSDLRDPVLHIGWRTGAIIPELEREIRISNSQEYQRCIRWLLALQDLIVQLQSHHFNEHRDLLEQWKREKKELRLKSKEMFNPRFGSVFRTHQNPTYFTRRLVRFADVYMSSLEDLIKFPLNYTFYPRRTPLPHESVLDTR